MPVPTVGFSSVETAVAATKSAGSILKVASLLLLPPLYAVLKAPNALGLGGGAAGCSRTDCRGLRCTETIELPLRGEDSVDAMQWIKSSKILGMCRLTAELRLAVPVQLDEHLGLGPLTH
jgi:hypothetical protein